MSRDVEVRGCAVKGRLGELQGGDGGVGDVVPVEADGDGLAGEVLKSVAGALLHDEEMEGTELGLVKFVHGVEILDDDYVVGEIEFAVAVFPTLSWMLQ